MINKDGTMFLNAKMVNVNTLEIVDMPYDDAYTSEVNSAYTWYYGYGKAYVILKLQKE